ncbi:MAG: zinc ribbon domain-containing protein, partial [Parasporobacterium sp.]|nr:zinc ribbon domain-containing protein [Parasporobacterium sp.]
MLCKECGADVNSSEVFCPNCGAPLRVTADYDFIQAEIGVKVDQVLNDPPEEEDVKPAVSDTVNGNQNKSLNIIGAKTSKIERAPAPEKKASEKKENVENTIAVTRTLFIKDSIFADEDTPDTDEEEKEAERKEREKSYRISRDERKRRAAERAKKKRKR